MPRIFPRLDERIARDGSDEVLRDLHLDLHDRCSRRTGFASLAPSLKAIEPAILKRHFRRVDGVVRAVVERRAHANHRVAGEHAFLHGLDDPLLDRGDEVPRHGPAHDLVHELEALLHGLEPHMDVAELAPSAGLLLVTPLLAADFRMVSRYGMRGFAGLDVDAKPPEQLLAHDLDLEIAHAGENGLMEVARHADVDRRVFLRSLWRPVPIFSSSPFELGSDRHLVLGARKWMGSSVTEVALLAERLARVRLAKLHGCADVSGRDVPPRPRDPLPLMVKTWPIFSARCALRVSTLPSRREIAGEDADHREIARVRLAARLETRAAERCAASSGFRSSSSEPPARFAWTAPMSTGDGARSDERIEEEVDPQHRDRGHRNSRDKVSVRHAFAKAGVDFFLPRVPHRRGTSRGADRRLRRPRPRAQRARLLDVGLELGGNRPFLVGAVLLEEERLHGREIQRRRGN
jgi:hypothetical protein